jgi:hypothetical protein
MRKFHASFPLRLVFTSLFRRKKKSSRDLSQNNVGDQTWLASMERWERKEMQFVIWEILLALFCRKPQDSHHWLSQFLTDHDSPSHCSDSVQTKYRNPEIAHTLCFWQIWKGCYFYFLFL